MNEPKRIAFLLPSLKYGGLQRIAINLLKEMVHRGFSLDLVLASREGELCNEIPSEVRVFNFQITIEDRLESASRVILPLVGYLQKEKPHALVSHFNVFNVVAAMAKILAMSPVKLTLVEHTSFSITYYKRTKSPKLREKILPIVRCWFYRYANDIVTVSKGLAKDLETYLKMKPGSVKTIYNPVIDDSLFTKSKEAIEHPWFQPGEVPIILGVGRLSPEKDFPTLIRAFAKVRQVQPVRLVILGGGNEESKLKVLIRELGLEADVDLPGFVSNPYPYIARSSVFVLSSYREGLPTVIIESMALGIPVVSTNCPDGPAEILDCGKYGELVPVGDSERIAQAILKVLSGSFDRVYSDWLNQFTLAESSQNYINLIGV